MSLPPIILASASPRRAQLLRQLVPAFDIVPSPVTESAYEHLTGRELCLLNAHSKARAVAKQHRDCLVIGADTLVCLETELFGKPADRTEARRMLARLQGRMHFVVTGVCLVHQRNHQERLFADTTVVSFRALSAAAIEAYHARVDPLDKAGAYAIQELGDALVAQIYGSYSNVVGLPVEKLKRYLEAWPGSPNPPAAPRRSPHPPTPG